MAKDSDGIDKTQKELLEDMAKALGSTGHQLESVIGKMKALEALMDEVHRLADDE